MRFSKLLLLATVIIVSTWSCKDEYSEIGGGILPDDEIISTHISKSDINAINELADAIQSANPSSFILGKLNDDEFGSTQSEFVTQFSIGERDTNRLKYDTNYFFNYAELELKLTKKSIIGDTLANHKVSVYELSYLFNQLENYKSDIDLADLYYTELVGSATINGRNGLTDSLWNTLNYVDTLRIPIDDAIGLKIFEADSATVTNADAFKDLFKGFYVKSELEDPESEGSLLRLSHRSYSHELVIHYYIVNWDVVLGIPLDTIERRKEYPVNEESVKVHKFIHDHSSANITFDDPSTPKLYIQPMGGSLAKVSVDDEFKNAWRDSLENTGDEHLGIAAVDMNFYIDTAASNYRLYPPPTSLAIYKKNTKDELVTPSFISALGSLVPGIGSATLVYDTNDKGEIYPSYYTFTFATGFLEEFVDPSSYNIDLLDFDELFITPLNPESNFNRVILHSSNINEGDDESIIPAYLSVKYVKLK